MAKSAENSIAAACFVGLRDHGLIHPARIIDIAELEQKLLSAALK